MTRAAARAPGCMFCDPLPVRDEAGNRLPCRFCDPQGATPAWFRGGTPIQRRRALAGRHPLNGLPLGPEGETCGACAHLQRVEWTRTFLKCALLRATSGPGTDTRAKWPACEQWVAAWPAAASNANGQK